MLAQAASGTPATPIWTWLTHRSVARLTMACREVFTSRAGRRRAAGVRRGVPRRLKRRTPSYSDHPCRAASMVAMSILRIGIIASKARFASPPPAASASVSARGVICQERPQRSLHQPHWLSWPPLSCAPCARSDREMPTGQTKTRPAYDDTAGIRPVLGVLSLSSAGTHGQAFFIQSRRLCCISRRPPRYHGLHRTGSLA